MTATYSPEKLPFRNALRVLRHEKKMGIVTSILMLLGIPLIMLALVPEMVMDSYENHSFPSFTGYAVIGMGCLGVAVFMGMITAIIAYTELWKKTNVDMLYSLPLTGTQRFFSNYLGGLSLYMIPYIISVLLGWTIVLIGGAAANPADASAVSDFAELRVYFGYCSVGLLVLMLLYYTLSVLLTTCCGTLFESLYTNFFLNCLIPGTFAAVILVICNEVSLDFDSSVEAIGYMSPIGGLIYLFMLLDGISSSGYYGRIFATQTIVHESLPMFLRWLVIILLLTAVLLVLAWQLYKRRKAELVGQPFVYKAAYHVMLTLVTVLILCLLEIGSEAIGAALLFSAIVYFVMEVIRKRGFKRFWVSVLTYLATVAVAVGAYFLVIGTGCFGRVNYVPAAAGISSVQVNISSDQTILEYTDREVIGGVTKLHKAFIDARKNGDPERTVNDTLTEKELMELQFDQYNGFDYAMPSLDFDDHSLYETYNNYNQYTFPLPEGARGRYVYTEPVTITYYTLAGNKIRRSYELTPDEIQQFRDVLYGKPLYAQALGDGLFRDIDTNRYVERSYTTRLEDGQEDKPFRLELSAGPTGYYYQYGTAGTGEQEITVHGGRAEAQRLADLYRQEMEGLSADDLNTQPVFGYLYGMFPVYESCTGTIEQLRTYGFHPFSLEERYGFNDSDDYDDNYNNSAVGFQIYAPGDWSVASLDHPNSTVCYQAYFKKDASVYTDYYITDTFRDIRRLYPEMAELLTAARKSYVTSEDCYAIAVGRVYDGVAFYVIPPEYNDLVEAVLAKGDNYYQSGLWEDYFNGQSDSAPFFTGGFAPVPAQPEQDAVGDDFYYFYEDDVIGSAF